MTNTISYQLLILLSINCQNYRFLKRKQYLRICYKKISKTVKTKSMQKNDNLIKLEVISNR